MTTRSAKPKRKKLSRGQRTHVRRLKQEAHHGGTVYRSPFGAARPAAVPKKEGQPPASP